MCSTSSPNFSIAAPLQPLNPQYPALDFESRIQATALKFSLSGPRPRNGLRIPDYSEVLVKPMIGNGFREDVYWRDPNLEEEEESMPGNGIGIDGHLHVNDVEDLKESRIYNAFAEMFEGFEERSTGIRVSEDHCKRNCAAIGMTLRDRRRRRRDLQRTANGGSELINMRSISETFDSRIQSPTQHVRFGMASSSPFPPEPIYINIFSHSNINFNGSHLSQHIGPEIRSRPTIEAGSGGDGGNGRLPPSGGGRGGGGKDDDDGDVYDDQFSRFMKAAAEKMRAEANAKAEAAAKSTGTLLINGLMSRFGLLVASCWILGNPILADPSLLFKVGIATQVVTGSCFPTFAELKKKGMEFWSRLFAADILFGITVDIALGGVLSTYARMGLMPSASGGFFGHMQRAYSSLPSSIFEGGSPGFNISLQQQGLTYFYEGILFGTAGLGCGLIYHAIVNLIRTGNRNAKKSEEENLVSSIVKNVTLWGVFLPLSSDTRHQIVKGLEKLIKASSVAKQVPFTALAFAVGIRFANNVFGGLLFAHWAKWSGIMKSES